MVLYLKDIVIRRWRAADPGHELARVQIALQELEDALEALVHLPEAVADPETRELLEADLMLARDKGWRENIAAAIGRGLSAEAAVQSVREDLRERMNAVSNDYIRARLMDLDDLGHRLLAKLTGEERRGLSEGLAPDSILVCRSLGTAELLHIGQGGLAGLVVVDATPSSHLAIIASSLRIPALGQVPDALTELHDGDLAILDAVNGQLIGRPGAFVAAEFEAHMAARRTREARAEPLAAGPCDRPAGSGRYRPVPNRDGVPDPGQPAGGR